MWGPSQQSAGFPRVQLVEGREFESQPSQTSHIHNQSVTSEMYSCGYLAWNSALLGYGKDWLTHYQNNVIVWDIGLWCSVA